MPHDPALSVESIAIVPLDAPYFEGMRKLLDVVAREKRYLAFTEAPAPEDAYVFYRGIVETGSVALLAISQDSEVVGWCDVLPTHGQARAHVGILGIGLHPAVRNQGLGEQLMRAAIAGAGARGSYSHRTDRSHGQCQCKVVV